MFGLTQYPFFVGPLSIFFALVFFCFLFVDWNGRTGEGLNLGLAGMGIMAAAAFFPWQVPDSLRSTEMVRSGIILGTGFICFGVAFVAYLTTNSLALSKTPAARIWTNLLRESWIKVAVRLASSALVLVWHILFGIAGIAWCLGLAIMTVQICLLWR